MDDRRGAQRVALPKPVPATFGGYPSKLLEISPIGCLIEHSDRVPPSSRLALRFKWRGTLVSIEATVIRSEMRSADGKPAYFSGLEFCKTAEESPVVVRDIIGWLRKATSPGTAPLPSSEPAPAPPPAVPAQDKVRQEPQPADAEEDVEAISADYLQCRLSEGEWMRLYVSDPKQPPDGFTIPAPANDAEADVLCRAYERADAKKRQSMRASFELAMKQKRR